MKKSSIFGIAVTVIWLLIIFFWGISNEILSKPLNEMGDYLAGMVAPIAFLWFILGYYQQSYEIGKNTEALSKQENALVEQLRALESQASSLSNAAKSLEEYNRPFVIAHFELKGSKEVIYFIVQNIGIRPAYNVEFKFNPPLNDFAHYKKMQYDNFVNLDFIPPGYRKEYIISNRIREIKDEKDIDWTCTTTISYKDSSSNNFKEEYKMSFFDSYWKIYDNTPSIEESLKKVNENLTELIEKVNQE